MQDSARYMAILELLEDVLKDEKPADNIINEYTRSRKYIGSKDRRFIIDTTWDIIRNRRKLEFDIKSKEPRHLLICYLRDKNLAQIFDGSKYGLSTLTENDMLLINKMNEDSYPLDVELETPKWLYNKIKDERLLRSLNTIATADFRINVKHRDVIIEDMKKEGFEVYPTTYSPMGIRLDNRVNLSNCITYQDGKIDVQDEGSQIISILCDVRESDKVVDYCAGAGGKSLTIGYLLNNKGSIDAHDIDWHRLEQIKPRMERLGINNINIKRQIDDTDYDKFIIDAPCSGTGTWRRSPDSKYRITENRLRELSEIQYNLIKKAYNHIKVGGKIIYITCSILEDENENVINKALNELIPLKLLNIKNKWLRCFSQPYPCDNEYMLRLSPYSTSTDGFFMAVLEKTK